MPTDFIDLEIRLLKRDEQGYPIELNDQTHHAQFRGGYLSPDLLPWVATASPREDGKKLLAALLQHPETKQAWDRLRGTAKSRRRLRLSIDATAPELHALPWELLHDDTMLAADPLTPFSRYLAGDWAAPSPESTRPLKMLVVIANPTNLGQYNLQAIDYMAEQSALEAAFGDFTTGQLERVYLTPPITLAALTQALAAGYHFWHIVAHGAFNKRRDEAALFLANANNEVEFVFESDLAAMLELQPQKPRLMFLAACQSATRSTTEAFRGFAPKLIAAGVPTVLAMQDFVAVETARAFSQQFYRHLFEHGQVDLASNQARAVLLNTRIEGSAIPVLFSRLPHNQLLQQLPAEALPIIPRKPYEPETMLIPAGPFIMGQGDDPKTPAHEVTLPMYRLGKYPVTNREYGEFLKHLTNPKEWGERKPRHWFGLNPSKEESLDHPVVQISWYDALAYCDWLSQATGRKYRLPSEAEWEKGARGVDGRLYPWGNVWQETYCNSGKKFPREAKIKTTPVTQYPQGASPYGCMDMVGNVCEWTITIWGSDPVESQYLYPYLYDDGREDLSPDSRQDRWHRILRGRAANDHKRNKSSDDDPSQLQVTARFAYAPSSQNKSWGFRVLCEIG